MTYHDWVSRQRVQKCRRPLACLEHRKHRVFQQVFPIVFTAKEKRRAFVLDSDDED